jgi:hypothetical protein
MSRFRKDSVPFIRTKDGLLIPKGASALLFLPELRAVHIRQRRGVIVRDDLGVVSRKVVTTAGVNYLAASFTGTGEPENFNFHASGTGNTAEAVGDTALVTEVESARVAGTQSNPSANIYRTVATIPYTGTRAIVEHGVFSASTTGTLWDRSVFSVINVVNGDSIQFTYNLTITAGG